MSSNSTKTSDDSDESTTEIELCEVRKGGEKADPSQFELLKGFYGCYLDLSL